MMAKKIRMGIVSQTPVIRFMKTIKGDSIRLSDIDRSKYMYTVGGVTPMVMSQLKELFAKKRISSAVWFSLNPNAPRRIFVSKLLDTVNISLEVENSKDYANFKQTIWDNVHNIRLRDFNTHEYLGYFRYNSTLARTILQGYSDLDFFEIHDFQQLLLGAMLGPSFPTVFRWHIPFIPEILSSKIRKFIINGMEGNDAIIVSTRRDLEGLIRSGFKGKAYQVYPHLDPDAFRRPTLQELEEFTDKYGIKYGDFLVLNVARMDRMKSQDDLIKAVSKIKDKKVKLMLVGNGSFTSNSLGLSKGSEWRMHLEGLVRKLGMVGRVIFTGYMPSEYLKSAYERADLFVLPSRSEGFGLVAVEAWLYNTPTIISNGAGVAELVIKDLNGDTFEPGNYNELSVHIKRFYSHPQLREETGVNAHRMARACFISTALPSLKSIYEKTIADF